MFQSEAIQSRCAVLRYSRLTDAQVLHRLLEVCEKEEVRTVFVQRQCHFFGIFHLELQTKYSFFSSWDKKRTQLVKVGV